ncbi:MAG: NAD-dependent epimerase/dehydratase family protein [Planctomycetota bacterium]|nr:NAD-dependent epimerase/dehydratase family protein [Planctomycetota bacterium]
MKTCLITGGAGNLGCQLTWAFTDRFDRIALFDVADGPVGLIAPFAVYEKVDLTDEEQTSRLIAHYQPNVVIHLASLLSGSCERDRRLGWKVNMGATFSLLEIVSQCCNAMFVFASSVATFGSDLPSIVSDDSPQWPDGLYGVTKMAAERLGVYYHRQHGLDFRCLRLPTTISRFAPAGAVSALASHAFLESARNGSFTFRTRPETEMALIYVQDVLRAIVGLSAAQASLLTRRVYNIHGISATCREIADAIVQQLPRAILHFEPDEKIVSLLESWPGRIDDTAAHRDWGWEPNFDLERMARHFIHETVSRTDPLSGTS